MKKSWHPLLHTNQERVWKQEKAALEERRKLEELKRERDQEREMQELQRIREAAGGKKKQDKLDWMYATPATGSGPSGAELEDYLLGKKRIDKLLQQDESQKVSGAPCSATSELVMLTLLRTPRRYPRTTLPDPSPSRMPTRSATWPPRSARIP